MSTTTTNFGLIKPELTDSADITQYNQNWDKIDEELAKSKEVFVAERGVTTWDEVHSAYSSGKLIFCKVNNRLYPLSHFDNSNYENGIYYFSKVNVETDSVSVLQYSLGQNGWPIPQVIKYAPTYSTEDLIAGESNLATGQLYFVYE